MIKIVEFCSKCSSCPVIAISEDKVEIGEKGNTVSLTLGQFEDLKQVIISKKV